MLLNIFLATGICQGIFLSVLFIHRNDGRQSNKLFTALLVLLSADMIFIYLNNSEIVLRAPLLYNLNASLPLLFAPTIYFYIETATGKIERLRAAHLFHLAPFSAHGLYMAITFHFQPYRTKLGIIGDIRSSGLVIDRKMLMHAGDGASVLYFVCLFAIAAAYHVAMVKSIIDFGKKLKNYFSDIRYKSFDVMVWILVISSSIWVSAAIVIISGTRYQVIPPFIYTFAIYVTAYKLISIPGIFLRIGDLSRAAFSSAVETESEQSDLVARIMERVESRRLFLMPEITIRDICDQIDVPIHKASKALNTRLEKNFYRFINEYRVETAKELLQSESDSEKSILSIGLDSGFASKSTFNDVFKKMTGKTPSDYRAVAIMRKQAEGSG